MASDENHGGSDCVKVAVRCRPPSQKEISAGEHSVVEMVEAFSGQDGQGQVTLVDPAGHEEPVKFAFDIVFGLSVLQSTIYETVGQPALNKTFEGYNGTIFAYGQTGSGKSFTMNGAAGDLRGITPRVNEELFQRIEQEQASSSRKFLVMCSYFEIYNEIIFDLLNPVSDRNKLGGGLQIKEHPVMGIYVKDLTEIVAEGTHKLEHMLESGIKNRAVSSTMMNATSSRSHSIFSIKVHQKDEEDASRNVFAKLNLVDLAGSERQKGTGATGQTLKEGANINKSLSALGNVINALVESANGKKVFIPYRNSKLTRVLQESLGGNSLCTMLATLSPAACNYEETMSTLRYANRAKAIKVSATKNEEASQISRLKAEVEELKKKLGTGAAGGAARVGLSQEEREAEKTNYEKQLREMEQMMNMNWGAKAKMSEEHEQKMKRLAEERRKAEQAVEEQRSKRLRFLQEQNDLELTIRGLIDFVLHLPTLSGAPPVLTGERPRQWLKVYRSLRMLFDELREHRMLVLTFKHGFDEDVKLWGEGIENDDTSIAVTGLNRCLPKLDKLRKGGEKLLQMETQGLGTASEFAESVRVALADLQRFQQSRLEEAEAAASPLEDADKTTGALEEVDRLLHIIEQQVQQKIEELDQLALLEMGQTCELVLHFTRRSATEEQQEIHADCSTLEAVILEPGLVSLPPPLPRKRLSEYTPDDVQDTPETTEPLLGMVIRWEAFCGGKRGRNILERLARPPPKFLWDITYVVKSSTGFPPELADWSEDREVRIAMFQKLADQVAHALGVGLDFDPADVLKGKEVHKTLRLLQLLAVAAAKSKQATAAGSEAAAAKAGVTRPQQLPMLLDAMMRCIMGAKRHMETQSGLGSFQAGGCHSMEARIDGVQHQLSEEARARLRQEEELAAAERDLQESEAELRRITGECDIIRQDSPSLDLDNASASMGHDGEQMLLQQQLDAFQGIDLSNPGSIQEENVTKLLQAQVEQVRMELGQSAAEVQHLEERQQDISGGLTEVNAETKALEADLQRQRLRCETEAELMGQSPEEQAVILQAHQQKLRSRAEALEAQLSQIQVEAEERKASMASLDTKRNDLQAAVEDTHLQMQIVQEERDGMREAMENLWNEKASLDEELENSMQAYTNLTESFAQSQDEKCEIESLVERKEQELSRLQRNGAHKSLDAKAAAIMQEATAVAS